MLDSGAFSAWKRGQVIDVDQYAGFLVENQSYIHHAINLDCIPGRPGKPSSAEEVDLAAVTSFKNYEQLRSRGLVVMPVFHCGESFSWLERMVDSGADYLGLGGTVGKNQRTKVEFFKRCFSILGRADRHIQTHGFGCTSPALVRAFPFTSVDSTSWVMGGANGYLMVPMATSKGFDYHRLHQVRVTGMGDSRGQVGMMGDLSWRHIVGFLEGIGTSLPEVRVDQPSRNYVNAHSTNKMVELCGASMFFSTWMGEPTQGRILTKAAVRKRLLSYWEVRDKDPADFHTYVRTGLGRTAPAKARNEFFGSASYVHRRTVGLLSRIEAFHD